MTRIPDSVKLTRQILRGNNHILHSLFNQSQTLLRIEAMIRRHVDRKFAISSFKNKQLVLSTETGADATYMRYRQRNLISALRRDGFEVSELKIKVRPEFQADTPSTIKRHLSPEAARRLISSAECIDNEPLKQALIKLSKRAG